MFFILISKLCKCDGSFFGICWILLSYYSIHGWLYYIFRCSTCVIASIHTCVGRRLKLMAWTESISIWGLYPRARNSIANQFNTDFTLLNIFLLIRISLHIIIYLFCWVWYFFKFNTNANIYSDIIHKLRRINTHTYFWFLFISTSRELYCKYTWFWSKLQILGHYS